MVSPQNTVPPIRKESRKLKPTVKCPECYSTELYKYGKDKHSNQKYLCKRCKRQFTLQSSKKSTKTKDYPKCPVCGRGMYLHHAYKYYVSFKCNNRKCNHTLKQLRPIAIDDPSSEKLSGKTTFSGHIFIVNTIITAINLYYALNSTTRAISIYLLNHMNIKVSHVTISKWIKKFDKYFKSISDELTQNLYLGDSDEWHADETVVKINKQKYYLWICIDSETRFITSWNLSDSRDSDAAYSLFKQAKTFGSPGAIVTDRWKSYIQPIDTTFDNTKHIQVESFRDDISNNLIESFNKTFKSWYKKVKGFKSFESANSLISNFIFYYNFIKSHSSLSNLTPAEVCGISYTHQDKVNWFVKY